MTPNEQQNKFRPCCENKTGIKTNIASVILSLGCHFLWGSLYNYPEDFNNRFNYPNIGSSLFVLAIALYCLSRSSHPKSLCIKNGSFQSIYKVVMVILITNILLVTVWQQLVNLTIELILVVHDICLSINGPYQIFGEKLGCYLSYILALLILIWVVSNMKSLTKCEKTKVSTPPVSSEDDLSRNYLYDDIYSGSYFDEELTNMSGDYRRY